MYTAACFVSLWFGPRDFPSDPNCANGACGPPYQSAVGRRLLRSRGTVPSLGGTATSNNISASSRPSEFLSCQHQNRVPSSSIQTITNPHHNVANFQRRVISFETAHRLTAFYKYTFFSSSFRTLSPRALVHRIPTMAGGKGKSSGGKSSGGKTSGVDGAKKQQSHSARAGLQVR